jgi:hypothetical protein
MSVAICYEDIAMCEFVYAHECPMEQHCCHNAAMNDLANEDCDFKLLRWFRERACPWDTIEMAEITAIYNSVALMEYLQQECVM